MSLSQFVANTTAACLCEASFQHCKDLLKYTKNKTDQIEQLDATIELIGERFHDEMMSMVQKNSDLSSQIAESASLLQGGFIKNVFWVRGRLFP